VLFEELKLPVVSHTKTGWSTATEALERIDHAHPIVPLVIRWRTLRRLRDSWITALVACIDPDGRVHSCFHPSRSFSGRIVNSNPDLGRVPGRTPEMARIRRAFVARPGHLLMSVDYSQLGLHVLAHLTRDPALVEPLRDGADVHTQTASAVLELPVDKIGKPERQIGKVINFATFAEIAFGRPRRLASSSAKSNCVSMRVRSASISASEISRCWMLSKRSRSRRIVA
jgi:DNA polymerase-1